MKEWLSRPVNSTLLYECLPLFEISEIPLNIAIGRGAETPLDVHNYFYPRLSQLHSPFRMEGMYEAVELIKKAINEKKQIVVFTDSDLDGITGLSVLYNLLKKFGVTTKYRFPVGEESYGLSSSIIDELKDQGGELLITIDSGIKDVEEISRAKSLGMDIIVTDHHEPDEILPDCIILNPKVDKCNYPFKYLAGAGVVFKLCHAILLSYLPSFNKKFYLINRRKDNYHFLTVRDGIILSNETVISINEFTEKLDNSSIVVAATDEVFETVMSRNCSCPVYHLGDWLQENNICSVREAAESAGLPFQLYSSDEDLIYDIFTEIQLKNSPRLLEFIKEVLGNVAIGNIADIMPLEQENRILTYHGIKSLNGTSHPGLGQLISNSRVDSKAIGWDIAPILNSPGRFGEAELTASFFLGEDSESITDIVAKVKHMNEYRKKLVQKTCSGLIEQIEAGEISNESNFLFLYCNEIPDGLAGLIANRLADRYDKPAIVATQNNEGVKGSGRAPGNFDFLSFITKYENYFIRLGGHAQAFGFTADEKNLSFIIEQLRKEDIIDTEDSPVIFDMQLPVKDVSLNLAEELTFLGPFGRGNEEPVFYAETEVIDRFLRFGKEKNHGKFIIAEQEVIGWGIADKMEELLEENSPVDFLYTIEISQFRGKKQLRLILKEIVKHTG